jgi:hypothetical protein
MKDERASFGVAKDDGLFRSCDAGAPGTGTEARLTGRLAKSERRQTDEDVADSMAVPHDWNAQNDAPVDPVRILSMIYKAYMKSTEDFADVLDRRENR